MAARHDKHMGVTKGDDSAQYFRSPGKHGVGQISEHANSSVVELSFHENKGCTGCNNSVEVSTNCICEYNELCNSTALETASLYSLPDTYYGTQVRVYDVNNVVHSCSYPHHVDYCGATKVTGAEPDIYFDVVAGFDRYSNYDQVVIDTSLKCWSGARRETKANLLGSQLKYRCVGSRIGF